VEVEEVEVVEEEEEEVVRRRRQDDDDESRQAREDTFPFRHVTDKHYCRCQHCVTSLKQRKRNVRHKERLANFNPPEDHIVRKDSPEGRTCVFIHGKERMG
jgi:hypothetical protein